MNKLIYILMGIAIAMLLFSCDEEDLDRSKSIFNTSSEPKSEFDKWLTTNYVETYNIDYKYRLEDIESDFSKNLAPADLLQSMRLCLLYTSPSPRD